MKETCANCGNEYDKAIKVSMEDKEFFFDSFECAIQMLAPTCQHCDTRVIGHGVKVSGKIYFCAQCARSEGEQGGIDRAG